MPLRTSIVITDRDRRPSYLVFSDLHLGELEPDAPPAASDPLRALPACLDHYAASPEGPWRLIIAGDMVDFLQATAQVTAEDDGLAGDPEATAVAAFDRIATHHAEVFRALADFVARGHELVILKGNHDAELHFDGVQACFMAHLVAHFRRGGRSAKEIAELRGRVSFMPWFYLEQGVIYVEHGNQYDAFCSFEHILEPVVEPKRLEVPISHRIFRDFWNMVHTIDCSVADRWRLFDYVRWLFRFPPRILGRAAITYFASVRWMLETRRQLLAAAQRAGATHQRRLRALAARFRLDPTRLQALDALRDKPAGRNLSGGLSVLFMDQVALSVCTTFALAFLLATPADDYVRAGIGSGVGGLAVAASVLFARRRRVEAHPKLLASAARIAELVEVPLVVFGHTHQPVKTSISAGADRPAAEYVNAGSWTHEGATGLTHVCALRRGERLEAELRRWDPDQAAPVQLPPEAAK